MTLRLAYQVNVLPSSELARLVAALVSVAVVADGVLQAGLDVWGWVRVVAVSVGWEGSVVESVRDAAVWVVDDLFMFETFLWLC